MMQRRAGRGRRGGGARECSGHEPAGSGGKLGGRWGNWRDIGKTGGNSAVSLPRGSRVSDWCCRDVPVLLIGSCHAGTGTRAPAHLLGSPPRRRDFRATAAGHFLAPNPNSVSAVFWEAFWGR
jgi:hypothetical protein